MNGSDDISLGLPSPLTLEFDHDVLEDWWVLGTVQAQDCVFHSYTFLMAQKQVPGQGTD